MTAQVLIVSAGAHRFGLDLDAVVEIVDQVVVTSLPLLPRTIAGVVEVHGRVVPLLDIAGLDGECASQRDRRSAVVANDGVRPLAMLIDGIEGIVDADAAGDATMLDLPRLLEELV